MVKRKINPYEKFGLYYKPTKEEFLHYYQQDLRRITLNLLGKRNLRLESDKIDDFIQELNIKIAFRKEPGTKPSRLERYDPFRNIKKKFRLKNDSIINHLTQEEFARCVSFKTYLYTIIRNYVANKAKQESSLKKKNGVSIYSNPEDPQMFITYNSINNYKEITHQSNVDSYLSQFEAYLIHQSTNSIEKKQIPLPVVFNCMKHSTKNKEIVKMLQTKFPNIKIKSTMVTRYFKKIKDYAKKFEQKIGSFEI